MPYFVVSGADRRPARAAGQAEHAAPLFFGVGPELFDLVQGEGVHVGAGLPGAIPADEEF